MKRSGNLVAVVAMLIGAMALTTGCKTSEDQSAREETTQETPAAQETPAQETPASTDESTTVRASISNKGASASVNVDTPRYAPAAPPPPRYERPARRPSGRHVWVQGNWRWGGREWVWAGGRWEAPRHGHRYVAPRYEREHGRYRYVPGHWARVR